MNSSKFFQIRPTTRRKALFVLVATFIFACLGLVTTLAAVLLFQPALMGKPRDVGQ